MAGLVPAIQMRGRWKGRTAAPRRALSDRRRFWIPGTRPGMTS